MKEVKISAQKMLTEVKTKVSELRTATWTIKWHYEATSSKIQKKRQGLMDMIGRRFDSLEKECNLEKEKSLQKMTSEIVKLEANMEDLQTILGILYTYTQKSIFCIKEICLCNIVQRVGNYDIWIKRKLCLAPTIAL